MRLENQYFRGLGSGQTPDMLRVLPNILLGLDAAEFQCSVVDHYSDQHIVVEWPSNLGYPHLTSNQNPADMLTVFGKIY